MYIISIDKNDVGLHAYQRFQDDDDIPEGWLVLPPGLESAFLALAPYFDITIADGVITEIFASGTLSAPLEYIIGKRQEDKVRELRYACNAVIEAGVDAGTEHFSLTTEDQIDIQNLAFQLAAGATSVLYHSDGNMCRVFTAAEFSAVVEAVTRHITYHTTYFNHAKVWVNRADDLIALSAISYGAALPEDLAEHMAQLLGGA